MFFNIVKDKIRQIFTIGFLAIVFQNIPYGTVFGYVGAALVQYDASACSESSDSTICGLLGHLYDVEEFAHERASDLLYGRIDSLVATSPNCAIDAAKILNEYTDDVLYWYLGEIEATQWYKKLNSTQRSDLNFQIKHTLKYVFGRAMQMSLAEFQGFQTTCQSQQGNLDTILNKFMDSVRKVEIESVVRHAVWNETGNALPSSHMDVIQISNTQTDETQLLPLVEANMLLNVRSGAGVNHLVIDGLSSGERVCVIEESVIDGQFTWVRVKTPEESSVGVDGWVFHGVLNGQPTLTVVSLQDSECVESDLSVNAG